MDAAWLKGNMFGMPRWAWIGLLVGGVGVGLYLRSRSAAADTAATDQLEPDQIDVPQDTMLGNLDDPGLAGSLETVGPAAGSVVPYASPTIPEGYPESFGALTDVISTLGEAITALGRPTTTLPSGDGSTGGKKGGDGGGKRGNGGKKPGGGGPPSRPDNKQKPKKVLSPAELEQYKKLKGSNPAKAATYLKKQAGKENLPVGAGVPKGPGGRPTPARAAPDRRGSDRGDHRTGRGR